MAARLISIIGAPATGKTTLAERLCEELPALLIREDFAGNPFLAQSYEGDPEAGLPGQLYFLMSRFHQLHVGHWPGEGIRVSDYGFCQDRIFARVRLGEDDYRLYGRLAGRLEGLVHPPDVLVHLDAAPGILMERIARRGRGFEKVMDAEFLETMRRAYAEAVAAWRGPVLRVDCAATDLRESNCRARLVESIRAMLEKGPCT